MGSVVPTLPADFGVPLWWSAAGFIVLCLTLLSVRRRLEAQRTTLERLYLALEKDEEWSIWRESVPFAREGPRM